MFSITASTDLRPLVDMCLPVAAERHGQGFQVDNNLRHIGDSCRPFLVKPSQSLKMSPPHLIILFFALRLLIPEKTSSPHMGSQATHGPKAIYVLSHAGRVITQESLTTPRICKQDALNNTILLVQAQQDTEAADLVRASRLLGHHGNDGGRQKG